jgi:EF-P beta-lysylation protein EpmB
MITWRAIQKQNFTDWKKLVAFLQLSEEFHSQILSSTSFPLNLPKRLAEKIKKNSFEDPILKQFLPTTRERERVPGFLLDPVADQTFRKAPKLLQKYAGRALLVTTGACAMHCRYCFRQNFDYATGEGGFDKELEMIRADGSLSEIILTGGDPLSLSDETLGALITSLSQIPHIKRLRFHSRFPIGIPERIDDSFLALLERIPLQMVFAIHCNHPAELDQEIFSALKKLQKLGIPILNQSVLLKGVNDEPLILKELCESLADHGILPYYLNQLDRVQGAAHFEVDLQKGLELVDFLRRNLSGYALPRYAKEYPGEASKTILH